MFKSNDVNSSYASRIFIMQHERPHHELVSRNPQATGRPDLRRPVEKPLTLWKQKLQTSNGHWMHPLPGAAHFQKAMLLKRPTFPSQICLTNATTDVIT
jgi:hypothetical protein